jgi:hypothetical protein
MVAIESAADCEAHRDDRLPWQPAPNGEVPHPDGLENQCARPSLHGLYGTTHAPIIEGDSRHPLNPVTLGGASIQASASKVQHIVRREPNAPHTNNPCAD